MSIEAAALRLRAPSDYNRAANEFGWKKIAVTTNHAAESLGSGFRGRYIWVMNPDASAFVHIAFSLSSTAEVDQAAADGTSAKVGVPIPPATLMRIGPLPSHDSTATLYMIHEGTAAVSFYYGFGDGE